MLDWSRYDIGREDRRGLGFSMGFRISRTLSHLVGVVSKKCRQRTGTHVSKLNFGKAKSTSGRPRRFEASGLECSQSIGNRRCLFTSELGVTWCCQGVHLQCPDQVGRLQLRKLVKFSSKIFRSSRLQFTRNTTAEGFQRLISCHCDENNEKKIRFDT